MISVHTDPDSGFCGGVIRAIDTAQERLAANKGKVYSLGSIVHNEEELSRLAALGLITIDRNKLSEVEDGGELLIRAHGEPPGLYKQAREAGIRLVDCTCPVVLALQKKIRDAYSTAKEKGGNGKIVIFGKIGHPEVLGLVGQVGGDAIVVENLEQIRELMANGTIKDSDNLEVFSQTTKSPEEYRELCSFLHRVIKGRLKTNDTICKQVAARYSGLKKFAESHDVVIFVSGNESSNGKVLFELCRNCNPRTYRISSVKGLDRSWFKDGDKVGVCGANSTPKWLLEETAKAIENLQ